MQRPNRPRAAVGLKAGSYFLAADDNDVPNPPTVPVEVINITVA